MGIYICKIHGRSSFVQTCRHVAEDIDLRKCPEGHRFDILNDFIVCDACFHALGFDRVASLEALPFGAIFDVEDGRYEAFSAGCDALNKEGGRVFCSKCVAQLESELLSADR